MTEQQNALPKWILIVSGIFALMEIGVSAALCISPQSVLETADLGANGVMFLFYMWAARQFALGFIFAFATWKKSVPMLTIAYLFFLVMFVGEFCIGIVLKESGQMIAAVLMCVISAVVLFVLNNKK